jgi:hypothetical protein
MQATRCLTYIRDGLPSGASVCVQSIRSYDCHERLERIDSENLFQASTFMMKGMQSCIEPHGPLDMALLDEDLVMAADTHARRTILVYSPTTHERVIYRKFTKADAWVFKRS